MQNFFQPANVIDLVAPKDLKSGMGFSLGVIFGIATKDAKQGAIIPTLVEGGVAIKKAGGAPPVQGAAATFDETAQTLGGAKTIGYIVLPVHPDDPTYCVVKLVPATG